MSSSYLLGTCYTETVCERDNDSKVCTVVHTYIIYVHKIMNCLGLLGVSTVVILRPLSLLRYIDSKTSVFQCANYETNMEKRHHAVNTAALQSLFINHFKNKILN